MGEALKTGLTIGVLAIAAAALLSMSRYGIGFAPRVRAGLRILLLAGATGLGLLMVAGHVGNVRHPRPWDFPPLYIAAKAAARGDSMYAPESLRASYDELEGEVDLPRVYIETVKTPFNPYLPVTALTTAPLGALDYRLALSLHCAMMTTCFALAVFVLQRFGAQIGEPIPMLASAALMLAYPPVLSAFALAQNVFGALLFVALWMAFADRKPIAAGLAVAAAFPFKHLALIPAGLSLAVCGYRVFTGAVISLAALAGLSVLVFGTESYADYARWGTKVPFHHYVEPVTQNFLAVVYRVSGFGHGTGLAPGPDLNLGLLNIALFLAIAALVAVATLWVVIRARGDEPTSALKRALVMVCALIVYPGTLFNTLVLMLPVFAVVLSLRRALGYPEWAPLAFVLVEYVLLAPRTGGTWWFHGTVPAMTLAWCFLFVILVRRPASAADS